LLYFFFGNFGGIEVRVLFTTLAIGGYSLTGLCSSVFFDRNEYLPVAFAGMLISVLASLLTVESIWDIFPYGESFLFAPIWELVLISSILAFAIAHSSLLLLARSHKTIINVTLTATIVSGLTIALMLI
jgi:hypothetical protein